MDEETGQRGGVPTNTTFSLTVVQHDGTLLVRGLQTFTAPALHYTGYEVALKEGSYTLSELQAKDIVNDDLLGFKGVAC